MRLVYAYRVLIVNHVGTLTLPTCTAYTGRMSTDEEKIEEIRQTAESLARNQALAEEDRARILELIQEVFPERRGERAVRGRLTEIVKATGWTREYIARIRDGKV